MDFLHSALEDLVRGDDTSLNSFFHVVDTDVTVDETAATCHFHCINLDGNGRPRVDALVKHLVCHLVDYAIPRKRIIEAYEAKKKTGSSMATMKLLFEAIGLFSRLAKSGEGGELILFLLAERFLKLPQLICKMNLKTSTQMHYHGADGLHIGVDKDKEKLCLYWGESKLFSNVTGGVYECMKSIAPLLLGEGGLGSPEERDLQLLGQYVNVEDPALENALKNYLDPDSPNFNKVEFRGLCLVGFDSDKYPKEANELNIGQVKSILEKELLNWQGAVKKRVTEEKIDKFALHVFLIPFPSVDKFRESFKSALEMK
ncbi:HamA C-terminal domain-containing protein [Serratia marcescens]|uniref:HamA C-terminal domain-containing protein n=1 Tax=Serratia marcescens TaxID=615 RepID=UPI003EE14A0D